MSHDANLLKCNGGHIEITKFWALSLLRRMGFVKRRSTTKCKISVADFKENKAQFLYDIQVITTIDDIPPELVINWDHTGINYVPVYNWTMAAVGSKCVEICGVDDKRQITAVFTGTLNGHFLPPQLIYQGKTTKCLPTVSFPQTWHVTHTPNHWANEVTTVAYINKILLPYITSIHECKGVTSSALVIFDRFKGQCTPRILSLLSSNNIHIAVVPGNCTIRLQPLDVSVNKSVKEFIRGKFQQWYSDQIRKCIDGGIKDKVVDLKLSIVKPLGAQWLKEAYDYMLQHPDIIVNGFRGSGILGSITSM